MPFLRYGPSACCCHNAFDRRTGDIGAGTTGAQRGSPRRRRRRKRPKLVDAFGAHDQRCPHAFALGRHDEVQNAALARKLREAGKPTELATVRELRASSTDRSRRKGDLKVDDPAHSALALGASCPWHATPRRIRGLPTTTTRGTHPARSATSLSLLASPYSEPIPACCVMPTSVVASRVVAENIPLAPVLRPLMRIIRRVYVGLTS